MTTSGRRTIRPAALAATVTAVMLAAPGLTDARPREDASASPGPPAHVVARRAEEPASRTTSEEPASRTDSAPAARGNGNANANGTANRPATAAAPDPEPTPTAPAATPAVTVAAAPAPAATPAAKAVKRAPRRAAKRAARRRKVQRSQPVALVQTPRQPVAATRGEAAPKSRPASARATRPQPQRDEAAREPASRRLPQLVTRIVEVIPSPVRRALLGLGVLAAALALAFMAAMLHARRLERRRRRLVDDVGLLQSALLPDLPARVGPATVTAAYRPAEGLAAGGDFYDAFALDEHRTCVMIGDVAGHGRDAIPVTASVRYTVRAYLEGGLAPRQALQVAGRVLEPQLRDTLVSVLVAVYDVRTGLLTSAAAGHPAAIVTADEAATAKALASPAFGLGAPTGRREVTVALPPGSAACFYTDGLADVVVDGDKLGFDALAMEIRALGAGAGAGELIARLVQRSKSQPDDMAAVVLRPPHEAPAARNVRIEEIELDAEDVERGRLDRLLAEYGVTDGVADAARQSVIAALASAPSVVIEVDHEPGGAVVGVMDSPRVASLPLEHHAVAPVPG